MDKPTQIERNRFYREIKEVLSNGAELTAREIAEKLKLKGIVHFGVRQEVHPRLTEMIGLGCVETVGSKFDNITKKNVTVYRSVRNGK